MSSLYVANGTNHTHHFLYRVIGANNFRRLVIPAGRQMKFPEDLDDRDLSYLINQLERYGARPVNDLKILHPRALVYKVERPVPVEKIQEAREQDKQVRQEVSAEIMDQTALAQFSEGERILEQSGLNPKSVRSSTLEVVELEENGRQERLGSVDAEITVSRNAGRRQQTKRRG